MQVTDRIVVVTGGGNGIGRAMVERFHGEGARRIVVADIDGDAAEDVARRVGGAPRVVDVANRDAVRELVEDIEASIGPIDLFCSNAGVAVGGGVEVDPGRWQRSWEVNVMGQVHAAAAVVPRMLERSGGYLLHTASAAGLLTNLGAAPYSVTKHAAVALAEWLAITYGDRGIRVSCLCPEFVSTRLLEELTGDLKAADWVAESVIDPADVAAAVIEGLAREDFLILPHPAVARYFRGKASDYDRWIAGMRGLQARVFETPPA